MVLFDWMMKDDYNILKEREP